MGQSNYAASKAGQVAFSKSLAKEAAKRSITVNCVSPGFIDTELLADLPDDLVKQYKSQVPMKRFGKPEEVANAVMFLASREASYITGTVLEVAGGL
jgi:3-oxoacyl-[acyl-carrier protein] reductase